MTFLKRVAAQPTELRMESTSSGSETSGSLSDFFTSMESKHRACANLGLITTSSKTVAEQSAEKLETPSESALPSLYDMPQLLQEPQTPLQGSGLGDISVPNLATTSLGQTTPLKSSKPGKNKKRKVTVSTSTQEAL